jgi:hypothetical protein
VIVPDVLFLPDAKGEHVDTLKHRAPTRLDLEEIHGFPCSKTAGSAIGSRIPTR